MEELASERFRFGEYELDCGKRSLIRDGVPLTLHAKSFDLLKELVANHGRIVTKDELLALVWPGQFVEENNLTVQVSALRKVFGDQNGKSKFIATVPGKGYSFVAEVIPEVTIENRSFSRVVVEEFEIKHNSAAAPKALLSRWSLVLLSVVSLLAVAGVLFGLSIWQSQRADVPFDNPRVSQLTTNGKVVLAALSPDGKLFAYVVDDSGKRALWLGGVAGGNHLSLMQASEDARYFDLAFSPDSTQLYFSFKDTKTPQPTLYRLSVAGGVPEKVVESIESFGLSFDGKYIAFGQNSGDRQLMIVSEINGSNRREVATLEKGEAFVFRSLSWSPDGQRLAFSKRIGPKSFACGLAVIELSTGKIRVYESELTRDVALTTWLPDGNGILVNGIKKDSWTSVVQYHLFHFDLRDGSTREITNDLSSYALSMSLARDSGALLTIEHRQMNNIWIAPADNPGAARQITFGSFGKYDGLWGMDFTPDGRIIYANSDTRSQFLSVMDADGTNSRPLTTPGILDNALNISPDAKYVVFHSNRGTSQYESLNIWRMDIDGRNPKQLTSGGKDLQPFVSADNRWVYFRSFDTDVGSLRRVSIDGGEVEHLNEQGTSWLSFSPDGRYFAAGYVTDKFRLGIFSAETNELIKQFDLPPNGTLSIGTRWTPDSQSVAFRDWNGGIWLQPVEGGEPTKMSGLPDEKLYNFAWSKDGKWFAFVRGQEIRDIVLLKRKPTDN